MKKSEEKKKLVEELAQLHKELSVSGLYDSPDHETSKDWIASVSSILKQFNENDYQHFQALQSGLYLSIGDRRYRIDTAKEVDRFVRQKVAEYKRYDFNYLDKQDRKELRIPLPNMDIPQWVKDNLRELIIGVIIVILGSLILARFWGIGR